MYLLLHYRDFKSEIVMPLGDKLGRNLEDLCPVKDCKGRPSMPVSYIDEDGTTRRTAVCDYHWKEFESKRPKHLGPPYRFVFKDGIQIRNL